MKRTFEIESSMYSATAHWVPGSSYYAEDVTLEYPDELDSLEDEELLEMASNQVDSEQPTVCYV